MLTIKRARGFAKFLLVQRFSGLPAPTVPHFDEPTNEWFSREISKADFYLEYGSGGTTIVVDKAGIRTISVEGDKYYAKVVKRALKGSSVRVVTPKLGITKEWSFPVFRSAEKGLRYVDAPFEFTGPDFPQLVLVDGRYRVACALETARRAKERGVSAKLLFDDYEQRSRYHAAEKYLGAPVRIGKSALFIVGGRDISREAVLHFSTDPE